jgi:hypothetical protein
MNKLLTFSLLGAGGYLAYRALQLNALAANITTRISNARIHTLNFSGMTVAVGVAINNPTKSSVKISKPVAILTTGGQYVGESDANSKTFTIAPQKVSPIGDILISIPLTSALPLFKGINLTGLFAAFKNTSVKAAATAAAAQIKMPIEAQISFYADSLFIKIPPTRVL